MAFFGFNVIDVVGGVAIQSIIPGGPLDLANKAEFAATGRIVMAPGDVITAINFVPATTGQLLHLDAVLPPGTTVRVDAIATSFGNVPYFVFFTLGGTPGAVATIAAAPAAPHPGGGGVGPGGGGPGGGGPGGGGPGGGGPGGGGHP